MPSSRACLVAAKLARVTSTVEKTSSQVTPGLVLGLQGVHGLLDVVLDGDVAEVAWSSSPGRRPTGLPSRRAKARSSSEPWPIWATSVSRTIAAAGLGW